MSKPQRNETPPEWLTSNFLEGALKEGFKDENLKISKYQIQMAAAVGDHYGSQMFRINFELTKSGKTENTAVVVKVIPKGLLGDFLSKSSFFEIEGEALAVVLPAVHEELKKVYPECPKLFADCIYRQSHPNNILILEDLKLLDFTLGNRFTGLDLEHSLLVVECHAKLHSTSLVMMDKNPKVFEKFKNPFWNVENEKVFKDMIEGSLMFLAEHIKTWPNFEERELYSEKLSKLNVLNRVFQTWEVEKDRMNVLLHGDSWINNFMFRYDSSGKLNGIKFVDFQLMNVNSPGLELAYFIFTSVNHDSKIEMIDALLERYHTVFTKNLEKMNHKLKTPYEFKDLKDDFDRKLFWGFVVFCTFFPFMTLPKDEVMNPDDFLDGIKTSFHKKIYERKENQGILKKGLRYFVAKGVI